MNEQNPYRDHDLMSLIADLLALASPDPTTVPSPDDLEANTWRVDVTLGRGLDHDDAMTTGYQAHLILREMAQRVAATEVVGPGQRSAF